jgi:hypothetical protein
MAQAAPYFQSSENDLPSGTCVAARLNLTGEVNKDGKVYALQSVHKGSTAKGEVLGYDAAVRLSEAHFKVNQTARAQIARGDRSKFPMAVVAGKLSKDEPIFSGVEIRFNPKTSHLFTRCDDSRAVRSASDVTVFNTRVYARGEIIYWTEISAPQPAEELPSDVRYSAGPVCVD